MKWRNACRLWPLFAALIFPVSMSNASEETAVSPSGVTSQQQSVDINKATAEELARYLDGVGPAKAQAIVAYREQHGPFTSMQQLLQVKGIGPHLLQRNKARILLSDH